MPVNTIVNIVYVQVLQAILSTSKLTEWTVLLVLHV